MSHIIPQTFFDRPTLLVAKDLLGKFLVRQTGSISPGYPDGRKIAVMITEVEAYDGPRDLASHASKGRTKRTSVMFGKPGVFYVYFTYGMHWLVNVVTGPKDYPAAILIRAGIFEDPETGGRREIEGPARLTEFMHITGSQNGLPARRPSGLWFEDRDITIPPRRIIAAKRIGVDYAGPVWAEKKWNFSLKNNAQLNHLTYNL